MKTLPMVSARVKDWNGHAVDTLSWQVTTVAGSDCPGDLELQALCGGDRHSVGASPDRAGYLVVAVK